MGIHTYERGGLWWEWPYDDEGGVGFYTLEDRRGIIVPSFYD
jgi:hypothetical protein